MRSQTRDGTVIAGSRILPRAARSALKIWVDGAGAPLEGQKAKACVVFEDRDVKVTRYERGTNNEMEYTALIHALSDPRSEGATIYTDSQLLVGQLTKGWKVRAANLAPLNERARALLLQRKATLVWVPREENRAGKVLEKDK
jgi:ribonuclease HI